LLLPFVKALEFHEHAPPLDFRLFPLVLGSLGIPVPFCSSGFPSRNYLTFNPFQFSSSESFPSAKQSSSYHSILTNPGVTCICLPRQISQELACQ